MINIKTSKILIPFLFALILLVLLYKFCFLHIRVSDDYYIQQKPFTNNYILYSHRQGKILENIYEWKETDKYIYGSGYKNQDFYYWYEKERNDLLIFSNLHDFYQKLDSLNLVYAMDNCTRIIDYKTIN